jgi:ACS family hexuronate transporter-like MFS transporter
VAGLVGFGGAMGGVVFNLIVGPILDQYGPTAGYRIAFAMSSTLHVIAFVIILVMVRRVQPLKI